MGAQRYGWVDITAGPVMYGPERSGRGLVLESSFPGVERHLPSGLRPAAEAAADMRQMSAGLVAEIAGLMSLWAHVRPRPRPHAASLQPAVLLLFSAHYTPRCPPPTERAQNPPSLSPDQPPLSPSLSHPQHLLSPVVAHDAAGVWESTEVVILRLTDVPEDMRPFQGGGETPILPPCGPMLPEQTWRPLRTSFRCVFYWRMRHAARRWMGFWRHPERHETTPRRPPFKPLTGLDAEVIERELQAALPQPLKARPAALFRH